MANWTPERQRSTTAFYDKYVDKLLADIVRPNRRTEAAIRYALEQTAYQIDARRILDVGCGIGWSAYELARHFPAAHVHAIDLSAQLVAKAQHLFERPNLSFEQADLHDAHYWTAQAPFDVIVLLDVYEHLPAVDRPVLESRLAEMLRPGGRIVLTTPSVAHQNYLRTHRPEGLQPVDEDVDLAILQQFARRAGLTVLEYRMRSLWQSGDYYHSTLGTKASEIELLVLPPDLEPLHDRSRRLYRRGCLSFRQLVRAYLRSLRR